MGWECRGLGDWDEYLTGLLGEVSMHDAEGEGAPNIIMTHSYKYYS